MTIVRELATAPIRGHCRSNYREWHSRDAACAGAIPPERQPRLPCLRAVQAGGSRKRRPCPIPAPTIRRQTMSVRRTARNSGPCSGSDQSVREEYSGQARRKLTGGSLRFSAQQYPPSNSNLESMQCFRFRQCIDQRKAMTKSHSRKYAVNEWRFRKSVAFDVAPPYRQGLRELIRTRHRDREI